MLIADELSAITTKEKIMRYEILADDGKWYEITPAQAAAYRADGVPASRIRKVE